MKKKLDIKSYQLEFENLPASFHGCRIGFFSDLHNKEIGPKNQELLEVIKRQKFDAFICSGDMIVGSDLGVFEYQNTIPFLKKLAKIAPVYYSMGNHEERMRLKGWDAFKKELEGYGIAVLDNSDIQWIKKGQSICIKGLSLTMDYYKRWWNRKPLTKQNIQMMIGKKKKDFTILLAHNPVFFDAYDSYGADLVLSGHIHGGLMILPFLGGVISPEFELFPKYDYGLYKGNDSKMILSRGLGTHTLPIRIHNRPEFVVITLNRTCDF